jgi:ketosteroid isomerase-like protein
MGVDPQRGPGKRFLAAHGSLAGEIVIGPDSELSDAEIDELLEDPPGSDPEAVVRPYYAIVSDLGSTAEDLLAVLHPDVRITEHPNAINPSGQVRDRDASVAGFEAGKRLLSKQAFDIHEVLAAGDRVAVKATWHGTIGITAGPFQAGAELTAHIASLLTVQDGLIREHETFDCYEPLPVAAPPE